MVLPLFWVFCIYLRTNSDLCHLQHKLTGFYNRGFNPLQPSGHYVYHQYNIQQLYALPTLYLCVLYLSENTDLCHLQHKLIGFYNRDFNPSQPSGHYMYHQYNIQQLYAVPTLYLCVLYLSENKQRFVPLTA